MATTERGLLKAKQTQQQLQSALGSNGTVSALYSPRFHNFNEPREFSFINFNEELQSPESWRSIVAIGKGNIKSTAQSTFNKYKITEKQYNQLRNIFAKKCGDGKGANKNNFYELFKDNWVTLVDRFLHRSIADFIFTVFSTSLFNPIWRIEEFLKFCLLFGRETIDYQLEQLLQICLSHFYRLHMRSNDLSVPFSEESDMLMFFEYFRVLFYYFALSFTSEYPNQNDLQEKDTNTNNSAFLQLQKSEDLQKSIFLPTDLIQALDNLENTLKKSPFYPKMAVQEYAKVMFEFYSYLPGLRDISMTACCLFGVQPTDPALEKDYVMELMLRRQAQYPQSRTQPYGPVGTEWCIILSFWWDNWRLHVGHKRLTVQAGSTNDLNALAASNYQPPRAPGEINNWDVLIKKKFTNHQASSTELQHQLLVGVNLKNQIEVIPPEVFHALMMWYGGGPRILRTVIPLTLEPKSDGASNLCATELELYPLCLFIVVCDHAAAAKKYPLTSDIGSAAVSEVLMSRMSQVSDIIQYQSNVRDVDIQNLRLWNYAQSHWKEQYILNPTCSLVDANLQDGQFLLLEILTEDGEWPRSHLQMELLAESETSPTHNGLDFPIDVNNMRVKPIVASTGSKTKVNAVNNNSPSPSSPIPSNPSFNCHVGLLNLGNTCYFNASLQALLHTPHLIQYFLSQNFMQDINKQNKMGYGGKLAMSFAKLVNDLYKMSITATNNNNDTAHKTGWSSLTGGIGSSSKRYISPKHFYNDITSIHSQFAGNSQHDAQELLTFLLDALSEDLNLVTDKPYIQQPDSNNSPDDEIANIWWENHLKRDLSIIQALFFGQFKSVTTCCNHNGCGFSSARFEPFNMLTLPIPEHNKRLMRVHVVPYHAATTVCQPLALAVTVAVDRRGDLASIISKVNELLYPDEFKSSEEGSVHRDESTNTKKKRKERDYIGVELTNSKIYALYTNERKILSINDRDNVFLYEVGCFRDTKLKSLNSSSKQATTNVSKPTALPRSKRQDITITEFDSIEEGENINKIQPQISESPPRVSSTRDVRYIHRGMIPDVKSVILPPPQQHHQFDSVSAQSSLPADVILGVRVSFVQRRLVLNTALQPGFEMYQLDVFGLPFVEICDECVNGELLYDTIASKVRRFLRVPSVADVRNLNLVSNYFSKIVPNSSESEPFTPTLLRSATTGSITLSIDDDNQISPRPQTANSIEKNEDLSSCEQDVSSNVNEQVFVGPVPRYGFTLRIISGGHQDCISCGLCPVSNYCNGCVIPDSPDAALRLRDGDTIAIDWNMIVVEELLDIMSTGEVVNHKDSQKISVDHAMPLSACLDKFTEDETLDGMVCPKCKDPDVSLKKSLSLWRLPPILVVQLKRFQFDSSSRRKLNNPIRFPVDGLDLKDYVATSKCVSPSCDEISPRILTPNSDSITTGETAVPSQNTGTSISKSQSSSELSLGSLSPEKNFCSEYDLYATVNHVGALSGGHYVAAVRQVDPQSEKNEWVVYNDEIVTPVKDLKEIDPTSSAYLLFYMRKDISQIPVQELFSEYRTRAPSPPITVVTSSTAITKSTSKSSQSNQNKVNVTMRRQSSTGMGCLQS